MNTEPIDLSEDKVNSEPPKTSSILGIDHKTLRENYTGKQEKKLAIANEKAAKERAKNTPDPRRTRYTTANTENLVSKQYLDPRYEKIRKDVDLFGSMKDLDKIAYANQSGWEVINNTVVGFKLNLIAGALDSFGANDPVGMAAMLAEDATYQHENWFNRQAKELQKIVGDKYTVFQSENGSMWNSSYWGSQLQNLGYSTGLIAETFAEQIILGSLTGGTGNVAGAANTIAKAGKLGKAFNMAKSSMANMSKFQRGFGAAQGFKQSYMNAIGAGEATYQQYKKLGYDDDVAKQKAAEASALNFKLQAIPLMLLNGFQYQAVAGKYNPFKGGKVQAQTGFGSVFETFAERTFPNITNKFAKGAVNYGVQIVSEAFEEGLETAFSKYAEFHTLEKDKLNKEPDFLTHLTKGHELRDSMIGGALGGAMFKAMGSAFSTRFSEIKAKREDEKRYAKFLSSVSARNYADLKAMSKIDPNDKAALNKHKREMSKKSLFEALQYDFLNQDEQAFNSHVSNLQEIQKAIQKKDLDYLQNVVGIENDAELDFLANNVDLLLEEAQETRSDFIKYHQKFKNDWQSAFQASHAESVVRDIEKEREEIQSNLENFRNLDKHYQALSEQGKKYYELMNQNTAMIISSDDTQTNANIAERTSVLNEMEALKADKDWKNKSSELASMSLIDRNTHLALKIHEQHNKKMLGLAQDKLVKWSDSKFREEYKIKQAKEAIEKAISVAEVEAATEVLPDNEVTKEKVAKAKVKAKKKEEQTKREVDEGISLNTQAPEVNQEQGQFMPDFEVQEENASVDEGFWESVGIQEEKALELENKSLESNEELDDANKKLKDIAEVGSKSKKEQTQESETKSTEAKKAEIERLEKEIEQAEKDKSKTLQPLIEKKEQIEKEVKEIEKELSEAEKLEKELKASRQSTAPTQSTEAKKAESKKSNKSVDTVIEENVSKQELDQIAEEEGLDNKEEAKAKVKEEVVSQMNDKTNKKPKTFLQKVAHRIKKILLNIAVVVTLINSMSFTFLPSATSLTYDNAKIENLESFDNVKLDQDALNKLEDINIITEFNKDSNDKYIIVDKNAAMAHLYQGDSLITSYEVGTGKNKGDAQTKTVVKNGKVYWQEGNAETGAGIYTINNQNKYKNSLSYTLLNENRIEVATVLHETLTERKKLFADNNAENNRMSYGCVNFQAKSLQELGKEHSDFASGSKVYILPDNPNNKFKVIDGQLVFTSQNKDVNRTPIEYEAQPITVKADNVNETGKDFLQTIADNKAAIMDLYPTISNDEYNQIVKIAYGIFGQESSFGTYGGLTGLRGQTGRITDLGQIVANDLLDKNYNPSVGVTQIRHSNVRQEVKDAFGINKISDLLNTDKAAIATMSHLLDIYVNEIPNSLKDNAIELLPLAYSNHGDFVKYKKSKDGTLLNNKYVQNVNKNKENVEVYLGLNEEKSNETNKNSQESSNLLGVGLLALLRRRKKGEKISDKEINSKKDKLSDRLATLKQRLAEVNKKIDEVTKRFDNQIVQKQAGLKASEESTTQSTEAKKADIENTNAKLEGTPMYFEAPNAKGEFIAKNNSSSPKSGASVYIFYVSEDGNNAEFKFHNDSSTFEAALNNPGIIIEPATTTKNDYNPNAKKIVTHKRGKAVLENGVWKVTEKAEISYDDLNNEKQSKLTTEPVVKKEEVKEKESFWDEFDELPLQTKSLTEEELNDLKRTVRGFYSGMKTKYGYAPSFQEVIEELIIMNDKDFADKMFHTIRIGWEANNFTPPKDYTEVYDDIFNGGSLNSLNKNLITLSTQILTEEEVEEYSDNAVKSVEKENKIVKRLPNNKEVEVTVDTDLEEMSFSAVFLSIPHQLIQDENGNWNYVYTSNELNTEDDINHQSLLGENGVRVGDELFLRIPDNALSLSINKFNENGVPTESETFGQYLTRNGIEEGSDAYYEKVPMMAYNKDGEPVFMIRETEWFNEFNVKGEDAADIQAQIELGRKEINALRRNVGKNESLSITITDKSLGTIPRVVPTEENNQSTTRPISTKPEAIVSFVNTSGDFVTGDTIISKNEVDKHEGKEFATGAYLELIKKPDGRYKAMYLKPQTIGDNMDILNMIHSLMYQYTAFRTKEEQKSMDKLLAFLTKGWFPQGIQNLSSNPGVLNDFLRNFIKLGGTKVEITQSLNKPANEVKKMSKEEKRLYDAKRREAINNKAVEIYGDKVLSKKKDILFSQDGGFFIVYRKLVNGKYEVVSRKISNKDSKNLKEVDGKYFHDQRTFIGLDEFMKLVEDMEFNPSEKMLANMDSPMITLSSDNSFTNLDGSGNPITMRDVLGNSMHSEFNSFQLGNETVNFVQPRISFSVSKTQSQKDTEEVAKKIEDNKKEKVSQKLNQPAEESSTDTSTIAVIEKTEEVVGKEVEGKPLSVDEVKISNTDTASAIREEVIEDAPIESVEKMINDLHQSMTSTTVIDSEHAIEGLSIEQTLDLKQYILNGFAEYISDEDALTKKELREFVEEDLDIIINSKEDEIQALEDRLEEAEDTKTLTTKINELKEIIGFVRKGKKELVGEVETTFYDLLDITKVNKDEVLNTDNDIGEDRIFDKGAVEMNPKSKSSAKLKRFMFGIQDRLGNKTKKGFLGVTKYKTFDEVYDSVIMTLNQPEGLLSSIDELLLKLEEKGKTDPTIKQVYDKLKNQDDATKNMFGYEMTKHTLKMQFLSYKKVGEDYELKVFDTNANDILKVIRNHFESELQVSGLIELDKNNKRAINKAKAKKLQTIAERISEQMSKFKKDNVGSAIQQEGYTKEGVKISDVVELLNGFGLRLSPESIHHLLNKGWYFDGINGSTKQEFKNMFSDVGLFGYLTNWLQNIEKRDTLTVFDDSHENHPFSDMSGILKGLVALENKYNTYPSPSVFRDAGKSVYGVTATTVATDTAQKLTHEGAYGEEYRNMLNSKGFNKTSYILEMLSQENSALRDKFEVNHLGLIALKQLNSDLFGDAGITDLSFIDHDYTKLGLFQDMKQGKIKPLIKNLPMRMATLFFPNMSDKTQMMIIKTAVFDITDKVVEVKKGKVIPTKEMLEMAYRTLVESELQRMLEFKAKGAKTDIKFYDEGASMFLMFPELNKLEHNGKTFADWLFNSDTNVDKKFFEDNFKEQAINSIKGLIDQEFTKTLNSFMDNGYISKDEKGKITTKLDKEYLKSRSSDSNKALNIAAMDFAFNSLLTNANIFQLFSGDPALYAKGASKFFAEKGVLKDEFKNDPKIYDKIALAADGNMDKRLALLIAPGSKIANSVGESYDQIMLQDWVSITSNVPFLVELYYGSDNVEPAKALINAYETADNVERKKAALKKLKETYPKVSGYFEIEGADAQEYTTAEEHLDILHRQGRVSQKVYEKAKQKIRNQVLAERAGKEISQKDLLNHAELKLMMQPIKPVYTGMINDTNNQVARTMYVKSSSFPLLPQLTKGRELNKIRRLLEDRAYNSKDGKITGYKGVRASYQSANKVGATTNALSIFNPDNTVREVSQLEIDKATVVLDRNNFRIQMDVPMKSLKKNEDKVSQGSQTLKLIMGDGIAQLKTDLFNGPKLKEEFDAVYEEYIDIIIQDLYDEVGLPSDGVIRTQEDWERVLTNLQESLITEAKDRGFAQNSIDGLQLRKRKNKLGETVVDFEVPLWLSPDSNRFESLMNAIVNNRINKIKLPGYSYVAASEAGMKMMDYDSYFERNVVEGTQVDELPDSSDTNYQELFEENPKLANAVYEALGFGQNDNNISNNLKTVINKLYPNWINNKNNELSLVAEFKALQLLSQEESSIEDRISFGEEAKKLINDIKRGKNPFTEDTTVEAQLPNLFYAYISGELAKNNISEKDMFSNLFNTNQITPQQKQEAQQKFQEYVNQTGKQDIQGFKKFVDDSVKPVLQVENKGFQSLDNIEELLLQEDSDLVDLKSIEKIDKNKRISIEELHNIIREYGGLIIFKPNVKTILQQKGEDDRPLISRLSGLSQIAFTEQSLSEFIDDKNLIDELLSYEKKFRQLNDYRISYGPLRTKESIREYVSLTNKLRLTIVKHIIKKYPNSINLLHDTTLNGDTNKYKEISLEEALNINAKSNKGFKNSERKTTKKPTQEIQIGEKQVIEENVPTQEAAIDKEPAQEVIKENLLSKKLYTTNTGIKTQLKGNPSKKPIDHVIYTPAWEGELKAAEFYKDENGKVVGLKKAQVMVGPKFRDNDGKLIELIFADGTPNPMYVEEKGGKMMLKDSISKDLLSITSFRIPTSSHQSMTQLEIVGILPFESGDIMVVPRNLTTQKGLDFDVDKETTYQLRHEVDSNGNIRPIDDIYSLEEINKKLSGNLKLKDRKKLRKLKKKLLENKLVRVYDKVLSSPEPQVQERINKVLSMDVANSQASMIDNLISDNDEMFTLASPSHQRNKMEAGSSGKLGIGVYSNMVTFHSMVQQSSYKDGKLGMIKIRKSYTEGEGKDKVYLREDDPIVFGRVESDGVLGKKDTIVNKSLPEAVRAKIQRGNTDVLAERQNIATDNVKEQVMGRVNINATTINVDALLVALGIDMDAWALEESELKNGKPIDKQNTIKVGDKYYRKGNIPFLFLSQPILREYVKGLSELGSQTKDFVANAKEEFIENLRRKYALQVEPNSNPELSGKNLYNNLINPNGATQLAVLDMFLKLDEKADSIRTLQSQLNANKGLGKSRIEASDKYDGLGNIIGRYKPKEGVYLEGYEALFGEVERPKDSDTDRKQELRAMGYKEFNGVFINPTNPMSKMIVESAAVSQELWSRFFIYDNPIIKDYFKEILNDSKTNLESDYAVIEFKIKLLKEIKKFFNSNPKNNITTKDANTKRRELFMDSENNESLAKYLLTHIKDIPALKENKLLGRFTYKLGENGSLSLIQFNNAVGEGFDDSLLYASLSILENQKDNIVLPNRNGKEYTVDMLIDDLVQYALLEGGVQEAIQFIKYIPIELLKRKGYSEYFNTMEAKDFAGDLKNFKVQFFQNNPKLLPKIQPKELVDNKDGTFSIKDLASLSGRKDFMVSMYDKNIKAPKQKYRVFKKSGDNYIEVPVLGTFGMSEYSPNMKEYGETILEAKAKKKVKPVIKVRPTETSKKEVGRKYTEEVRVLSSFIENGKGVDKYLEHISNYEDLPQSTIEYIQMLIPFLKDIDVKLLNKTGGPSGAYRWSMENEKKGFIEIRKTANNDTNTRDYLIRTLLHEATHAMSSDYLNTQFEKDGITLRKDASQEAKDLKALFDEAIDSRGAEFKVELDKFREDLKKYRKEKAEGKKGAVNPITAKNLNKYYPFLNVKEFVAEMFTKESFRNEMDNVKSNVVIKGVSTLKNFVDIIRRILGKAGIRYLKKTNLKPNNIASNTFLVSAKIFEADKALKDKWFPEEKKTAYDKKDNDVDIEDILGDINFEENKADTVFVNEAMAMKQPEITINQENSDNLESSLDFIVARGIEQGTFPLTTSTIQQVINGDKSMTIRQIGKEGLNRPGIYPFEFNGETRYFYISQVAYDRDKGRTLEGYTSLNKELSQESIIESFNVPLKDIGDNSVKKFLEGNNRVQKNLFKITDITKEYTERKAAETVINCK